MKSFLVDLLVPISLLKTDLECFIKVLIFNVFIFK